VLWFEPPGVSGVWREESPDGAELANIVGGISADRIMNMKADEQILLIEGKHSFCKQARYDDDELFQSPS
jgi:hypothetical protein